MLCKSFYHQDEGREQEQPVSKERLTKKSMHGDSYFEHQGAPRVRGAKEIWRSTFRISDRQIVSEARTLPQITVSPTSMIVIRGLSVM